MSTSIEQLFTASTLEIITPDIDSDVPSDSRVKAWYARIAQLPQRDVAFFGAYSCSRSALGYQRTNQTNTYPRFSYSRYPSVNSMTHNQFSTRSTHLAP